MRKWGLRDNVSVAKRISWRNKCQYYRKSFNVSTCICYTYIIAYLNLLMFGQTVRHSHIFQQHLQTRTAFSLVATETMDDFNLKYLWLWVCRFGGMCAHVNHCHRNNWHAITTLAWMGGGGEVLPNILRITLFW